MRILLLALVGLLAVTACRSTPEAGAVPTGTWAFDTLEGADLSALARTPEVTIGADGLLAGFTGVNRFSGRAEPEALTAGRLQAGPLAATRMAGPPAAMKAESKVLELLAAAPEWRRAGEGLELLLQGKVVARLHPSP